jgi:hypothetical protein
MEKQIDQLEKRLQRRERELTNAIEDGKVSARIERARLVEVHKQVYDLQLLLVFSFTSCFF